MPEDVTIQTLIEQNRRATHTYLKNRDLNAVVPSFEEFNDMIDKGYVKPETIHNLYSKDGYDVPDIEQFKKNLGIGYADNETRPTPVTVKQPYEDKTNKEKTIYDNYVERQKSIEADINDMAVETANQIKSINEARLPAIRQEVLNKYTAIAEDEQNSTRWNDPLFRANFQSRIANQASDEYNDKIGKLNDETEKFYMQAIQNITDMAYAPTILQANDLELKKGEIFGQDWYMDASTEDKNNILKASWAVYANEKMRDGTLLPQNYYQAKKEYMHYMLTPLFKRGGDKADTYALKNYLASLQSTIKEELERDNQLARALDVLKSWEILSQMKYGYQ